jgi:hypothetical protein
VIKNLEYGLDTRLRRQERFLFCDPAIVDLYNEGYLLTHPAVPYNEKFEQNYVEGSNRKMTFAPLDGLAGTGVMFIAPKKNVIYGYDGVSDEEKFEVLRLNADTFTVNAKMFFGVGFRTYDKRFLKVVSVAGGSAIQPNIEPREVTLAANATYDLNVFPSTGWTFSSSATGKATVNSSGKITGVAAGTAKITCTNGTTQIVVKVTVTAS